jgi:altronate dehydratase
MIKTRKTTEATVTDPKTGKVLVVRGLGCMKNHPLDLDPRIDLTKPIYEQVLALEKSDREREQLSSTATTR